MRALCLGVALALGLSIARAQPAPPPDPDHPGSFLLTIFLRHDETKTLGRVKPLSNRE